MGVKLPCRWRQRGRRTGLPVLETGMGDQEDGHGAEGVLSHDQLLTDPDQAVDFVSKPRWMLWLLRLAPAMALTNSPRQLGKF